MKWIDFKRKYPNHDRYRFESDNGDVRFLFNGAPVDPFDSHGNLAKTLYHFNGPWKPEDIRDFLHLDSKKIDKQKDDIETMFQKLQYPIALLPLKTSQKNAYPIPAIPFSQTSSDISSLLTSLKIYTTPTESFIAKMRNIFQETIVKHKTQKCARSWLAGTNFQYWPQQLSFAVYCALGGCGVSITDPSNKNYPPIIQGLLKFHTYLNLV